MGPLRNLRTVGAALPFLTGNGPGSGARLGIPNSGHHFIETPPDGSLRERIKRPAPELALSVGVMFGEPARCRTVRTGKSQRAEVAADDARTATRMNVRVKPLCLRRAWNSRGAPIHETKPWTIQADYLGGIVGSQTPLDLPNRSANFENRLPRLTGPCNTMV